MAEIEDLNNAFEVLAAFEVSLDHRPPGGAHALRHFGVAVAGKVNEAERTVYQKEVYKLRPAGGAARPDKLSPLQEAIYKG